jgi:hypothetical protein
MLGWAQCGSHKKRTETRLIEPVFLHPVRFVAHVVRSGTFMVRSVDTLFFMLGWERCTSHKKRTRTRYTEHVFLHPVRSAAHVVCPGRETSIHYFS